MAKALMEEILKVERLKESIYQIDFKSPYIAQHAKAGQFVNIRVGDGYTPLLRRPISICDVDEKTDTVSILFQVKAMGTQILASLKKGDFLDVLGPLGRGFFLADEKEKTYERILVVGGGIGTFPLLYLLKKSRADLKLSVLGFRHSGLVVLEKDFEKESSKLCITTDDGSYGRKGMVVEGLAKRILEHKIQMVYACGPTPMLKGVMAVADQTGTPCQVSMEQRMGCGIGACLVCAVKAVAKDKSGGEAFTYKRVCKDGPVFWKEELADLD
jgi:dihydroorotate dehydrogenase electron transfer subunit